MSEYAGNLVASLHGGARMSPNEAARAALPLVQTLVGEHVRGLVPGSLDPAYVAPEVSAGKAPTTATDVWSVGALLFHAIAGHPPYELSAQQPARLRRAGWLGPLVEMMLATDPAERPHMAEVADYLQARQASEPEPTIPEALAESAEVAMDEPPPRRRTAMLVLVLAALVVTLGIVAVVLVLGHRTGPHTPAAAPPPLVPTSSPATTSTQPTTPPKRARHTRPSARELAAFARRYVTTASSEPSTGFGMLTAAYQRESPRYVQFWSAVDAPQVVRVAARPATMSVTYTYRYRLGGRTHVETVTLDLVRRGGRLLIAGAR
ncbi:hypothetical protein GCM10028801_44020 [Nocardioides maradonensis]